MSDASPLTDDELAFVTSLVDAGAPRSAEVVWDRPHVVRVTFAGGGSVIVKRPRTNEQGEVSERVRGAFERERAVLELLADVPDSPAPHLYGALDGRLLVMEDLPPGRSLAELLLATDEHEAHAGLVAFGAALGRLHASTAEAEERFGVGSQPVWAETTDQGVAGFAAIAERFGSTAATDAVVAEGHELADGLRAPGWWRTLVHGDPCPDNTRVEAGTGRFRIFDFEVSSFGSCVQDASYLVAPFPTCWCFGTVPDGVASGAVAAYRSALGAVRPQVLDDAEWDGALAIALGSWIVGRGDVIVRLLERDREWGTTTVRVRVRRWLDAFLDAAERADRFPALRVAGRPLAAGLAEAWPEASLVDYPALPTGAARTVVAPEWWRPGL